MASRNRLASRPRLFASQIVLGAILERFGEAKTTHKSIFGMLFGDVFFERVLASISDVFLEARNLKNHQKPLVFLWFLLIFTKSTFSKQVRKKLDFRSFFGSPNDEKLLKNRLGKYVFFERRIINVFFRILTVWARFWKALGVQKSINN